MQAIIVHTFVYYWLSDMNVWKICNRMPKYVQVEIKQLEYYIMFCFFSIYKLH